MSSFYFNYLKNIDIKKMFERRTMVKKIDVINWAKDLANRGTGVNYDGKYGMQCVDLPFWICGNFFRNPINGNAIDLLTSASSVGYQVIYYSAGVYPKAGDIFVMHSIASNGVDYGHTGLVIEDSNGGSMTTIEQNIDGNADALINGAPARYNTRSFSNMVGWIRPNYESEIIINPIEEVENMNDFFIKLHKDNLINGFTAGAIVHVQPCKSLARWTTKSEYDFVSGLYRAQTGKDMVTYTTGDTAPYHLVATSAFGLVWDKGNH